MNSWTEPFFSTKSGPAATVRTCRLCGHAEIVRKGRPGVGRGYGMREGNKARGRMIQHIKWTHWEWAQAQVEYVKCGWRTMMTVTLGETVRRWLV